MTYWHKPNISLHMRYFSNPVNRTHRFYKLKLMESRNKFLKRCSYRSKYLRMQRRGLYYHRKNPLEWFLDDSKSEQRFYGRFNR